MPRDKCPRMLYEQFQKMTCNFPLKKGYSLQCLVNEFFCCSNPENQNLFRSNWQSTCTFKHTKPRAHADTHFGLMNTHTKSKSDIKFQFFIYYILVVDKRKTTTCLFWSCFLSVFVRTITAPISSAQVLLDHYSCCDCVIWTALH